jgi:hypothetical protein
MQKRRQKGASHRPLIKAIIVHEPDCWTSVMGDCLGTTSPWSELQRNLLAVCVKYIVSTIALACGEVVP